MFNGDYNKILTIICNTTLGSFPHSIFAVLLIFLFRYLLILSLKSLCSLWGKCYEKGVKPYEQDYLNIVLLDIIRLYQIPDHGYVLVQNTEIYWKAGKHQIWNLFKDKKLINLHFLARFCFMFICFQRLKKGPKLSKMSNLKNTKTHYVLIVDKNQGKAKLDKTKRLFLFRKILTVSAKYLFLKKEAEGRGLCYHTTQHWDFLKFPSDRKPKAVRQFTKQLV